MTSNRSSQAKQSTMQDLCEGIFISMVNLTLARRDSYLEYLRGEVKQDILTALYTAPVHLISLFPVQLLVKTEDEISRNEERHSSGSSHRKPGRYHPYMLPQFQSQPINRTGSPLYLLGYQIRDRQQGKKGQGKPSNFLQKPAKCSKQSK